MAAKHCPVHERLHPIEAAKSDKNERLVRMVTSRSRAKASSMSPCSRHRLKAVKVRLSLRSLQPMSSTMRFRVKTVPGPLRGSVGLQVVGHPGPRDGSNGQGVAEVYVLDSKGHARLGEIRRTTVASNSREKHSGRSGGAIPGAHCMCTASP